MATPMLQSAAELLETSEPALRLIISILIGYPLALVSRYCLFKKDAFLIHLFHTLTGLWIAYFNFGFQLFHSFICILVQFLFLRLMGRTVTAVGSSFLFQMGYLLTGYYYTATDYYDIKWTMPHCVLALKLIGLSLDYYDGGKDEGKLNAEQKVSALRHVPSFSEVCGFAYFYGGFLVGPQFTLRSYQRLVAGELTDCPGQPPNSIVPAIRRFSLGLVCLAIYTIGSPYLTDSYMLSDDYAEGVCILSGLGYNGHDSAGVVLWDACANMKVWQYETTPLFTGTIASFNINTNAWVASSSVAFNVTRSLNTFFVFEALQSQMPSDGYGAAVSTSNGLNLGRGSSSVLTDIQLDPPAQCW
ncbi:MBOA5 acyltransferase, partial [Polypterus senegalus]